MVNKPGCLCTLKKGQLIDANEGFVDTFNWMKDFLNELSSGTVNDIEEVDIVTGCEYDESSHEFTIKTRKARVVVCDLSYDEETVFTATALSEE